ncbi:cobyrinate a,c-diamide synthase [Magnetospira sp. QH-2]|uniref:cobyrinate a,c-diamide synthase n=1 Tax=Magnetospira sp. (strain QH-2) TaxID=1288970 RepID=UPI0003E81890|nr:cobyrinate a,c-diamide synthase [Magnetospira sp. QH-2]CCQ74014.1 Cobyrinic acid A,C-diamide synthase CobB/DsrN [Magnetospira sp. QH-2]
MGHVYISAAHKSSGKTTVSIGLCAALARRGLDVRPFKRGPDYIDPLWLGRAAGSPCHNLDFHVQSADEIRDAFDHRSQGGDISLIEGNKGLYDGMDLEGVDCNAALAKLLRAPVILVIDCQGMTRGVAPLVLGNQAFDPEVEIGGIILNKVGGPRHEEKLRAVLAHYTEIPVLGAVHKNVGLEIKERHLGLMPSNEDPMARAQIEAIADAIEACVDLDQLLTIANQAPASPAPSPRPTPPTKDLRIAVARDAAFGFYYPGDLEALEAAGAALVFLDMTRDQKLPPVDGLFLGGGFPETQAAALSANHAIRTQVREALEGGLPAYAECGGLMYLSRSVEWQGETHEMVGFIPGRTVMGARPQGRGYTRLKETGAGPWPLCDETGQPMAFPAHEFHYSRLIDCDPGLTYAWQVLRGHGIDGQNDGIVINNVLAGYGHMRHVADNPWTERFVAFVRAQRQDRRNLVAGGTR